MDKVNKQDVIRAFNKLPVELVIQLDIVGLSMRGWESDRSAFRNLVEELTLFVNDLIPDEPIVGEFNPNLVWTGIMPDIWPE